MFVADGVLCCVLSPSVRIEQSPHSAARLILQVGSVVQRVCTDVAGLARATEVTESPLDRMFGGGNDKAKSLVLLKEEATNKKRMRQRATKEAGKPTNHRWAESPA